MGTVHAFTVPKKLALLLGAAWILQACSLTTVRPYQEMADTKASIAAAKEVGAEKNTPDLYRQAVEWFSKAKQEYQFKNFAEAKFYAKKSRKLAEQAEYISVIRGAERAAVDRPIDQSGFESSAPEVGSVPAVPDSDLFQQTPVLQDPQTLEEETAFQRKLELEKARSGQPVGNPPEPGEE